MFTQQTFARRYLLLEKIATGGMAEVFKAKSYGVEGFEKLVVIKRILPHLSRNARFVSMFINEAKIAVSLNHGNIVQVFHLGKDGEDYFIAMEFVHGRDLMQVLKACRQQKIAIPLPLLIYIATEVARGLDYAHRKQDPSGQPLSIIHRDISPHNLVVSYEGEVKIVDFGIARITSQILEEGHKGRLGGKFAYMSPEQAEGHAMDARSDLFSLGLVLYELITGQKAYQAKGLAEKLEQVRTAAFAAPRDLRADLPEDLERILLKSVALRPEDRYQSAADLYEDLTELMFLPGRVVTAQDMAEFMRSLFKEDIAREREASGLKAVMGSLERMDRTGEDEGTGAEPVQGSLEATRLEDLEEGYDPEHTLAPLEVPLLDQDGATRRSLLVLAAELTGLPDLSLSMPDDRYLELLTALIKQLQELIRQHGGYVESFHQGRLYVLWGLHKSQEDDPERAMACAQALRTAVRDARTGRRVELDLSVALHAGPALVGRQENRPSLLVLGDTYALVERLLLHAPPGELLVSDQVRPLLEGNWLVQALEPVVTGWGKGEAPSFAIKGPRPPAEKLPRDASRPLRRGDRWFPRRDELEILRTALSQVDSRRGRVLGLSGEAGIGKTRLVAEVGRLVQKKEVGWRVGRATWRQREVPLAVFRDLFASSCRIEHEDTPDQIHEKLSSLLELGLLPSDVQFIHGLFDTAYAGPQDSTTEGLDVEGGIYHALRRLIRGMCADRPVLFVFENLQWMDPLSLRVLHDLAEATRALPVLILVTYRTGFQPPFTDGDLFHEIAIQPLSPEHTLEMAQALLGVNGLPDVLADAFFRRSDGNPFHLEQLVKHLLEGGHIRVENQTVVEVSPQATEQVPPTLQGLIASRVDSLSERARDLLRLVSVIGRQTSLPLLRQVAAGESALDRVLQELVSRDLISLDGERLAFRNHLTWEVAYHSVVHRDLMDYHAKVGAAMEKLHEHDLSRHAEELYQHFEAAGLMVQAARYASMAGDRYRREDFLSKAVDFYLKSVELLRSSSREEADEDLILQQMARLYLRAGRLQLFLGDRDAAEATLEKGLDLAGELEDDDLEARHLLELGRLRADKGDRFLAQSYFEHALELSEALSAVELFCLVLEHLGTFHLESGQVEAAGKAFDRALSMATRLQRPGLESQLLRGKGSYLVRIGDYAEALVYFQKALALAQEAGDRGLSGRTLSNIGVTYAHVGRFEDAMEAYRRAGELHRTVGFMRGAIINWHNMGDLYFQQGHLGKAYNCFRESRNLARDYRWAMGEAGNLVYMGYIEASKGDTEGGLRLLNEGVSLAEKSGHPEFVATGLWLEGTFYARQGQLELARSLLTRGLDIASPLRDRKLLDDLRAALDGLVH